MHAACLAAEQSPLGAAPRQRCVPEWRSRHAPSQPCRVYYDGKEKPEEVWAELADGSCRWRQTGSEIKVICLKVHHPSVLPSYAQEAPPVFDTGAVCLYHKVLRCYDVHKFSVQAGYWCCGFTMSTKSGWSHVDGVRAVSRAFQVSCPSLGVRQHSHSPLSSTVSTQVPEEVQPRDLDVSLQPFSIRLAHKHTSEVRTQPKL